MPGGGNASVSKVMTMDVGISSMGEPGQSYIMLVM